MNVYKSIALVMGDLSKEGITKNNKNQQQGYMFRGIDNVYNALAPLLSKHGLLILPRVISRDVTERQTKNGSALFYVVVEVEFDLVSAEDGSKHTVKTCGEAMDSADKATNKAMSAAYKYACLQAFCIPTEGDNDAEATTHDNITPRHNQEYQKTPISDATLEYAIVEILGRRAELSRLLNFHEFTPAQKQEIMKAFPQVQL